MNMIRKSIMRDFREGLQAGIGFFVTISFASLFFLSISCAKNADNTMADIGQDRMSMEEEWGVAVESLRPSGAGNLLDFRYRIKDPDKAVQLVDRRNKPYLIDQESGKVLAVPNTAKVGPLRQTLRYGKPKDDRVYFVLFGNPGGMVKSGDQVTVVIGDFRAENLTVE